MYPVSQIMLQPKAHLTTCFQFIHKLRKLCTRYFFVPDLKQSLALLDIKPFVAFRVAYHGIIRFMCKLLCASSSVFHGLHTLADDLASAWLGGYEARATCLCLGIVTILCKFMSIMTWHECQTSFT